MDTGLAPKGAAGMGRRAGMLLRGITWLLMAASLVMISGGLMRRPLLVAAVPTGSMAPVLNPGDLILLVPAFLHRAPVPGDIIVFRTREDRSWVVHRVVGGSQAEGYVTRGDANQAPDPAPVYPADLAGVVPSWPGGALRIPRLGLLSGQAGSLHRPVLGVATLALGAWVLVSNGRRPASGNGAAGRGRNRDPLPAYAGLAAMAFVVTLLPGWALTRTGPVFYQVLDQPPPGGLQPGQVVAGAPRTDLVPLRNPAPIPLVAVLHSDDPALRHEPPFLVLPPRGEAHYRLTLTAAAPGRYTARTTHSIFLPLLPPGLLAALARWHPLVAALAAALVPPLGIAALAWADGRARHRLNRLFLRIQLGMDA